jgi:pimeloyl-ACP methyl ester carboxylesterase
MTETIFMIHGMMVGPWCWDNYKRYFEEQCYCCITPTLRFHDMDPNDAPDSRLGSVSLLDYVADLEEELGKLHSPPILMGHSMGGLLVQILACRGLGKAAVLLTPAPPRGILVSNYSVTKSFLAVMMHWGFWKKPFRFTFGNTVYSVMHLVPEDEQKAFYDKMVYESGRAFFEIGLWFLDPNEASRVDHGNARCPVLVISGKEDRITPASVVRKVAEKYRGVATYREFENHAHSVLTEPGWQGIAEYVYDWMEDMFREKDDMAMSHETSLLGNARSLHS